MFSNSIALDYDPNSIYQASKKISTISLKNLEDSKKNEFTQTSENIKSKGELSDNINEFLLGMKEITFSVIQLEANLKESISVINTDLKDNKYITKASDIMDEEYNILKTLNGGSRLSVQQGNRLRNYLKQAQRKHLRGGAKGKPKIFVDTSQPTVQFEVGEEDDEEDDDNSSIDSNVIQPSNDSSSTGDVSYNIDDFQEELDDFLEERSNIYAKVSPATTFISKINSTVLKLNLFFNSKIKKFIFNASAPEIQKIKKSSEDLYRAVKNIDYRYIAFQENGILMLETLNTTVSKLLLDVSIAVNATGAGSSDYSGSGRFSSGVPVSFRQYYKNSPTKYLF
jgi:hypothetical protein